MIRSIIIKISNWWEGELQIPEIEELFSGDEKSFENKKLAEAYKYHWSSKITRTLWFFWKEHWKILLPIIIGAIVALFIHFDSKPTSKSENKENHQITSTYNVKYLS